MDQTKFDVRRFDNRNGTISWRVTGWLRGVRIRKNFKTREEAAAEKSALEIKAGQAVSGLRSVVTSLTVEQVRDAETAFRRLAGQPHSLGLCVDYTLTHYRAPAREASLTDAVNTYVLAKRREQERGVISGIQVGSIRKELKVLQGHFPHCTVATLTAQQLTEFCERGKPCLKTYNNRRGILSTFFKFAFVQDWVASNPVEKIPYHRIAHRRGSAKTITAEQAGQLMAFLENHDGGRLVSFFALCLFAGLRPCVRRGEITKLKAESVRLDTGVIRIEPEVSKVRMPRIVTIQPNLAAWLRAYPLAAFPIVPPNLENRRRVVTKKFGLTHDVLRHTFISMFVAKFRSMGEAALQAGNSETIIRKHYLELKSRDEAERFFSILPKRRAVPSVAPVAQLSNVPAPWSVAV